MRRTLISYEREIFLSKMIFMPQGRSLGARISCDIILLRDGWTDDDGRNAMITINSRKRTAHENSQTDDAGRRGDAVRGDTVRGDSVRGDGMRGRQPGDLLRGDDRRGRARVIVDPHARVDNAQAEREPRVGGDRDRSGGSTKPGSRADRAGSLKSLADAALLERLCTLRGRERAVLVRILYLLNEVERRRLYVGRGYASLYEFCIDALGYSRSAAMRRIHAARCVKICPAAARLLRSGAISLTALAMVSGIINSSNAREILHSIRGRSTRDVELLISRHRPAYRFRDRVRPICLMVPENNSPGARGAIDGRGEGCGAAVAGVPASAAVERNGSDPAGAVTKNSSSRFPGAGKIWDQEIINKQDSDIDMTRQRGESDDGRCESDETSGCSSADQTSSAAGAACKNGAADGARSDAHGGHAPGAERIERVRIEQKYAVEFTVEPEFMEKLERVKSLLSRKYPTGLSFEVIFTVLMHEYLDRHDPEKRLERRARRRESRKRGECATGRESSRSRERGENNNSRPGGAAVAQSGAQNSDNTQEKNTHSHEKRRSRHIPQEIQDIIFARDGGRCTFIGPDGKRCNSRWNLQVDHIIPFARGGDHSPENLRLLCAKHNISEAERLFGKDHMKKFRRRE